MNGEKKNVFVDILVTIFVVVFLTVALVSSTATAALSSLWCRQSVCVVEKGFENRRKMFVFVDIWVTGFFVSFLYSVAC